MKKRFVVQQRMGLRCKWHDLEHTYSPSRVGALRKAYGRKYGDTWSTLKDCGLAQVVEVK